MKSEQDLVFEIMGEEDIQAITPVMRKAFDDDAQKHLGIEKGGRLDMITGISSGSGSYLMMRVLVIRSILERA